MASAEDVAQLQELLAQTRRELQALRDAAAAAPPPAAPPAAAGVALDPAAFALAVAAAIPAKTVDYSKDLDKIEDWDITNTKLTLEDFIAKCESKFASKGTPQNFKCRLIVEKFQSQAMARFKTFTNAAGNTNDAPSTTWVEFKPWMLKALKEDELTESYKIEKQYAAMEQKGSAEKFAENYRSILARIQNNPRSVTLHTPEALIENFVAKLKPGVRIHMIGQKYTSIDDAIAAAITRDNVVFEMGKSSTSPAPKSRPPTPNHASPYGSRGASPSPQLPVAALQALLAAVGVDPAMAQTLQPSLNAMGAGKDHSVAPTAPVPALTDEIRNWCRANNACFRCREKNMMNTHRRNAQGQLVCPRFGPPNNAKQLYAIDEEPVPGAAADDEGAPGNGPS